MPKFKKVCYNDWVTHFNTISKDKDIWYKTIQMEPPRFPWFDDTKLSRNDLKLFLRIRSGHYPSAKFPT